jgi:hypothetical protein
MASLTAKVVHGKTYYYARDCQRVGGKPKIVRTIYLGSADDLIAAAPGHTRCAGVTSYITGSSVDFAQRNL